MDKIKIAYNPTNDKIIVCKGGFHADEMPVRNYDLWVRAIWFPKIKTIYFRFWSPTGEYQFIDSQDIDESFTVCEKALREFKKNKIISKKCKILWWETDSVVTQNEIKY